MNAKRNSVGGLVGKATISGQRMFAKKVGAFLVRFNIVQICKGWIMVNVISKVGRSAILLNEKEIEDAFKRG